MGDSSTATFFLHAGVVTVAQLKCALFRINVCVMYVHVQYVMGKCALYVGLMLLTIVYVHINII